VEVARLQRGWDEHGRRLEIRADGAAASAPRGVEAGRATVQRTGENREPRGHDWDAEFAGGFLDQQLVAARLWRGLEEIAVGRVLDACLFAEDADELIDLVVI